MILRAASGPVRLSVAAVGDVGVVGRARARARREGFERVFAGIAGAMRGADLGFANLEFPVGEPEWVEPGRAAEFRHDPEVPAALVAAGVRVVSLANNHMMDCGARGLLRTLERCAAEGLETAGAGATLDRARQPARLTVRGRRVVLLAYAAAGDHAAGPARCGVAPLDRAVIERDLERWRPEADDLIVSAHWGSMYVDYPPPRVLEVADWLIAHGVDLVLGHHPHVTQGFRARGAALTLFSLGDIVFDPSAGEFEAGVAGELRRDTGVFTVTLAPESGLALDPLVLDADGVPAPADPVRAAAAAERLARLGAGLEQGAERFRSESAPTLLRYELESLGTYLRRGRLDRALKLLFSLRPRHVPLIWSALTRRRGAGPARGAAGDAGAAPGERSR